MLGNANAIFRILAPVRDAFRYYNDIIEVVKEKIPKGSLVILALGPTATVMAYDLALLGYQALDLGHFDIQYEYHIRNIHSKEPIPGKYVNEAGHAGQTVESPIEDDDFKKSVLCRIGLE